ncbi:unnamed protein product [Cochlearia groenlandica]
MRKKGSYDHYARYMTLKSPAVEKNNGNPCDDGDVLTDVTRYIEVIINPATTSWCRQDNLVSCPPYQTGSSCEILNRTVTSQFPYSAYHLYCSSGNAEHLEKPYDKCDPYNNLQAQELIQILPHRERSGPWISREARRRLDWGFKGMGA